MPFTGDDPVLAWEYWFDEPPSESVLLALEHRGKDHASATIIEAIEIASKKTHITDEIERLKYVTGILRRKTLEAASPQLAERERPIDVVLIAWKHSGIGTWPISRQRVAGWIEYCTAEEVKALLKAARNWSDFRSQIEDLVERRQAEAMKAQE